MSFDSRFARCAAPLAFAAVTGAHMPVPVPAARDEPRVVEVTARRYAFEPSPIEVTVGERVRLVVRSADGVHGFEIRRFNVNRFLPRDGSAVVIDLVADRAGRFPVLCSEYCGSGHDDMRGVLVVHAAPSPEALE